MWTLVAFWHAQKSPSSQIQGCTTLQEGKPQGFGTTCCQPMPGTSPVKHFNGLTSWLNILQTALQEDDNRTLLCQKQRRNPVKPQGCSCWMLTPFAACHHDQRIASTPRVEGRFPDDILWVHAVTEVSASAAERGGRCSELGWEMLCCMPIFAACQTGGTFYCSYQGPETW